MRPGRATRRSGSIGDFDAVLAGARANAPEAWNALYGWLAPGVAGYLRMLGARDVEDVTSEVLLAVFRRIGSFEGTEANFRSWVFTVAHSRVIDERRRRTRRPDTEPFAPHDNDHVASDDPAGAALEALEVAHVERVCAELPADQRAVVLLRIIGELSIEQVAEILGKSQGAVKQLQRRAFETIRQSFAREGVTP